VGAGVTLRSVGVSVDGDRRRFLRDLDRLAAAVVQPMGDTTRTAPRTHDATRGELTWRVRVEPEDPTFPAMFRLTWGVRVPGLLERRWPPGSADAKALRPDYAGTLFSEDVEQIRSGRSRVYKYRVGNKPGLLGRLNPLAPDQVMHLSEMTTYLTTLVEETLTPQMTTVRTRSDLADWMERNQTLCGYARLDTWLRDVTLILRDSV